MNIDTDLQWAFWDGIPRVRGRQARLPAGPTRQPERTGRPEQEAVRPPRVATRRRGELRHPPRAGLRRTQQRQHPRLTLVPLTGAAGGGDGDVGPLAPHIYIAWMLAGGAMSLWGRIRTTSPSPRWQGRGVGRAHRSGRVGGDCTRRKASTSAGGRARAFHRWQGLDDVPSVASRAEARVHHGDHATVGPHCGSAARTPGRASSTPTGCQPGRHSIRAELLPPGRRRGIIGARERDAVDHDERQGRAGTSTPWNRPAVANRQVSALSANTFTSAGFGEVALGQVREPARRRRSPSAASSIERQLVEQGQCAAPGGGDQGLELVVHRQ